MVATYNDLVISNQQLEKLDRDPCGIEESDERMLLHAYHISKTHQNLLIKTVDSDVVVIALAVFQEMYNLKELWIEFGVGKTQLYLPIHELSLGLGVNICRAYPFFHSLSGCDTTSSVAGKGKKSFHATWELMPEVTPVFEKLSKLTEQSEISEDDLRIIEHYFVVLYSTTVNMTAVNEARRLLFANGDRSVENIPPTMDALKLHVLKSALQASKWSYCLQKCLPELDPLNWGWLKSEGHFKPFWTTLPEAPEGCRILIKCGCKKSCSGRCKCVQNNLPCTELCFCSGQCTKGE